MLFIKAFLLFIPIVIVLSIIVYIHLLILLNIYNYIRLKWYMNDVSFLFDFKYKGKSAAKLFFAFFLLIHFLLFIDYYRSYINSETKYHEAKVYYAVGLVPHTYSVILGRFLTPLNPIVYGIVKPTNIMKEYLFEKGIRYIPSTDAERELWEYEWFYYPYAVHFWDMYDSYHYGRNVWGNPISKISRETHNYLYEKVERLYEIIKAINKKNIKDSYRESDALRKVPLMSFYYLRKSQFLIHRNFTKKYELKRDKKKKLISKDMFNLRKIEFIYWLESIKNKSINQIKYQEWKNKNLKEYLKIEATRELVLLNFFQRVMYHQIYSYEFHCKNEITKSYIKLRNEFMMENENSVLNKLAKKGDEKLALWMYDDAKSSGDFFRLILKKYCLINLLGIDKFSSEETDRMTLDSDREIIKKLNKGRINE